MASNINNINNVPKDNETVHELRLIGRQKMYRKRKRNMDNPPVKYVRSCPHTPEHCYRYHSQYGMSKWDYDDLDFTSTDSEEQEMGVEIAARLRMERNEDLNDPVVKRKLFPTDKEVVREVVEELVKDVERHFPDPVNPDLSASSQDFEWWCCSRHSIPR